VRPEKTALIVVGEGARFGGRREEALSHPWQVTHGCPRQPDLHPHRCSWCLLLPAERLGERIASPIAMVSPRPPPDPSFMSGKAAMTWDLRRWISFTPGLPKTQHMH